jgi:hypothetical protein
MPIFEERRGYHTFSTCKIASQIRRYKLKTPLLRHPRIPSVYFAVPLAGSVLNAIPQHSPKVYISFMSNDDQGNKSRVEGLPHQAEWASVRVEYRYMERIMRSI